LSIPDNEADRQGHLGKKALLAGGCTVPRLPKPFRWRDGWYTDAGGKRTRLLDKSATFTAAQTALRQLLLEQDQNDGRAHPNLTVAELIRHFLAMVQADNSPQTYYQYQRWLNEFAKDHSDQQARKVTTLDGQQFKGKLLAAKCPTTGQPYKPAPSTPP
jgi:hypothetical protein